MQEKDIAYEILIEGLVQGVGFRPFLYKLVKEHKVTGWVRNTNMGVTLKIQGNKKTLDNLIGSIHNKSPSAADIKSFTILKAQPENLDSFTIIESHAESDNITEVSPDILVCNDCLSEMHHQTFRVNYPFINCTNCGPRFTIIKNLPYDRDNTTMDDFQMCDNCAREYNDISDRRFHAQPIACEICGPHYKLQVEGETFTNFNEIIDKTVSLIENGKIMSAKGQGGYHIMCDAFNEESVKKLRESKSREGKPFAVMFKNIENLKEYAFINDEESNLLESWRRPIMLLKLKKQFNMNITVGFNTLGAMLPYMPFHFLLFEKLQKPAIVLTSGNISDEPITIDDFEARKTLGRITTNILSYNRKIHNRTDDSVCMVVNQKPRIIRRSRGYAPAPIRLKHDAEGIIATGAELTNCFCIGKKKLAIISQHIGDLKNIETYNFFKESLERHKMLFRVNPQLIAADMHPDYLSTRYAKESGLPIIKVQHHHAHIASCMTEHGLDEKVIGVSFDGTGYGTDGHIWGGEFLICDLNEFERTVHLNYMPMPGGDLVTKEPWRMAVSYLKSIFGNEFTGLDLAFLKQIDDGRLKLVIQAIDKQINTPLTSGVGRLFDTVAAITGVCINATFHAEAPMRLEALTDENHKEKYEYDFLNGQISVKNTIRAIVRDLNEKVSIPIIATRFHNTIISIIFTTVLKLSGNYGIKKVILSGGVFQNRYILEKTENMLRKYNFEVYSHTQVPSNDGGIALGQLAIAAKRRAIKCV